MLKHRKLSTLLLNGSKSYLSFIKFKNEVKHTENAIVTDECGGAVNNGAAHLLTDGMSQDVMAHSSDVIINSASSEQQILQYCAQHSSSPHTAFSYDYDDDDDDVSQQINLNHDNEAKIIWVLYANDCAAKMDLLHRCNQRRVQPLRPVETSFQLKLVNVHESNDLTLSDTNNKPDKLLDDDDSGGGGNTRRWPLLVCILLTNQMVTALLNGLTNSLPMFESFSSTNNTNHKNNDSNRKRILFILYDETNEINMFQIKYKLAVSAFIERTIPDLYLDIVHCATRLCSESLLRRYQQQQQQQQQQPNIMSHHLSCCTSAASVRSKALFKAFPKAIYEANEKVLLLLQKPINTKQKLVDVLLNGQSTIQWLSIKWQNAFTLSFTIPDHLLQEERRLEISLVIDCTIFLGTRILKNKTKTIDWHMPLHPNSTSLWLQSTGVHTMQELDEKLSRAFDQTLPDFGLFTYLTSTKHCGYGDCWLPTWIHFAAAYGLKMLLVSLLKSPAAARACNMRNQRGLTPKELAQKHGHREIVYILEDYCKCLSNVQEDMLLPPPPTDKDINSSQLRGNLSQKRSNMIGGDNGGGGQSQVTLQHAPVVGVGVVSTVSVQQRPSCTTLLLHTSPSEQWIMQAKNELLLLIEKFKSGISIQLFEELFSNWEKTYKNVLDGQMSDEFRYSLTQIKMLCSSKALFECDDNDDNENNFEEQNCDQKN